MFCFFSLEDEKNGVTGPKSVRALGWQSSYAEPLKEG